MNKPQIKPIVDFNVQWTLTEQEVRALDALACYGTDEFLDAFYENLGRAYLEPYEKDLRVLFEKIKELRPAIREINDARKKLGI